MCLLIVLFRLLEDLPLVIAANRDELFDRPALPMTVLRDRGPRVIGGRDAKAGGTWLAVNELGVAAGLTNRPTMEGPDGSKRSRGELPLLCAQHRSPHAATLTLASSVRPSDFNPAWLLVADSKRAFAVGASDADRFVAEELEPGIHVLENRPFGAASAKVDHVRALLDGVETLPERELLARLRLVLADHQVPKGPSAALEVGRTDVPDAVGAACVHTERYGTRWSGTVVVSPGSPPEVSYAAGSPCTASFTDATSLFTGCGDEA